MPISPTFFKTSLPQLLVASNDFVKSERATRSAVGSAQLCGARSLIIFDEATGNRSVLAGRTLTCGCIRCQRLIPVAISMKPMQSINFEFVDWN